MKKDKIDYRDLPEHKRPVVHKDHAPARTRRELLAQGFLGASGAVLMPSILTILQSQQAYGAPNCGGAAAGAMGLPMLIMDLAGGANFAYGNVLVGKAGNGSQTDFLDDPAAQQLGSPPEQNPKNDPTMVDNELGLLFHRNSGFLAGLRSATTQATRDAMNGMIFCTRSNDDSRNNPLNPSFWITAAGAKGSLVDIIGNGNSEAKGRSTVPPESLSSSSSVSVTSSQDARSLVNTGLLGQLLPGQEAKVLNAAHKMSASRLKQFDEKALPVQIQELIECGYIKSTENLTSFTPDNVDATLDTAAQTAINTNNIGTDVRIPAAFQADNSEAPVTTQMAKLVLEGWAGVGTIEMGGYDYHGQGRRTQSIKDFAAGRNAGLAFEMARLKEKPLMMVFVTDGAVAAGTQVDNSAEAVGRYSFQADSGTRSSVFMLVYSPAGRPESTGIYQVGGYQDGSGAVDQAVSPIGNSVPNLTKAIALNYLALTGKEGDFDAVVKGNPFGNDLSKYIGFAKLK